MVDNVIFKYASTSLTDGSADLISKSVHHDNLKYGSTHDCEASERNVNVRANSLSLLQRDQPEIWHYLDQMPHSTPRAGLLYRVAKKVHDQLLVCETGGL